MFGNQYERRPLPSVIINPPAIKTESLTRKVERRDQNLKAALSIDLDLKGTTEPQMSKALKREILAHIKAREASIQPFPTRASLK